MLPTDAAVKISARDWHPMGLLMKLRQVAEGEMSTRRSRCSLLVALPLALLLVGLTQGNAGETSGHYPGDHVANCKPAPIVGCVCETDPLGQVSIFPQRADGGGTDRIQDVQLLRLIDWLRRTCMAMIAPTNSR